MNIYDIAARSGVSIATVSRVLNNSPKVSPKTRERVLAVMKEEDYVPNVFARGLGLNTMRMVGILCVDIADPCYASIVAITEKQLRKKGWDVMLSCTGPTLKGKKKGLDLLLQKHVDCILLVGSPFREEDDNSHIETAAAQVPVIMVNGLLEAQNVYSVVCDDKTAMQNCTSLLLKSGCQRVLYCYDALTYSGKQKLTGYRQAHAQHEVPVCEELLLQLPREIEETAEIIQQRYAEGLRFDAVLGSEDMMVVGVQHAMKQLGLSCPVIGWNNSILAKCTSPTLTSVDNNLKQLCSTVVSQLIQLLEGDTATVPQKVVVSSQLVERESFVSAKTN